MGIKKIIKKVLKELATIRINEVISLLGHFGYGLERIKGSHFIFTKTGERVIIIPVHNKHVERRIYIKQLKEIIISSLL